MSDFAPAGGQNESRPWSFAGPSDGVRGDRGKLPRHPISPRIGGRDSREVRIEHKIQVINRFYKAVSNFINRLTNFISRLTDAIDFRLMSAYLDADIGGGKMQLSGPVTVRGRPTMLAWFEDVQVRNCATIEN